MLGNVRKSRSTFLERGSQVYARAAKCRCQAGNDPRKDRYQNREAEDPRVGLDREIMDGTEPVAGSERRERPIGQKNADRSTRHSEENALRQQLTHNSCAARA